MKQKLIDFLKNLTKSTIGAEVHSIFTVWLQAEDLEIRASIWPIGAS